ncbi:Zn-dependent hydrolase [Vibrio ishigakensis]|uniref:Zn-dependent hydrolase n=1 Tax=Vibrio ishigakensis TaxID=1481914 RepID=A0A0B8NXP6_9VIBR|nr:Zn-dependent hydrolase [Vibrio ishigakensis]
MDHLLDDGDSIKGFEDWQALFTQGHTDRDLSILHIPSKTLYIADLLVMVKGRLIPRFLSSIPIDISVLSRDWQSWMLNISCLLMVGKSQNPR